jgi:hypothetical protein
MSLIQYSNHVVDMPTDPVQNKSVYNSSSKKWRRQESPNINVVKKKSIELGSIRLTDSNHQSFIIFDVSN